MTDSAIHKISSQKPSRRRPVAVPAGGWGLGGHQACTSIWPIM